MEIPANYNASDDQLQSMLKKLKLYAFKLARVHELTQKLETIFDDGLGAYKPQVATSGKTNKLVQVIEKLAIKNSQYKGRDNIEAELQELEQLQLWIHPVDCILSWLYEEEKRIIKLYFIHKEESSWPGIPDILNKIVWLESTECSLKMNPGPAPKPKEPKQFVKRDKKFITETDSPGPLKKKQTADPWEGYRSNSGKNPWKKIRPYTPTTRLLIVEMLEENRDIQYIAEFLNRDPEDLKKYIQKLKSSKDYIRLLSIIRPRMKLGKR